MPLVGAKELREKLRVYKQAAPAALGAALYEEGVAVIEVADERVPYEFGHLRRSHFAELPRAGANGPELEIGYGAGYGLYVHEVPANHPKGGEDHWLRNAVLKRLPGMDERLARRTGAHLAAGESLDAGGIPTERPDPMEAIDAERADRERARRRGRAASIRAQNAHRSLRR
jgi:hypothetical protein